MTILLKHDIYYNKHWYRAGTPVWPIVAYPAFFLQVCGFGSIVFLMSYGGRWPAMEGLVLFGGLGILLFVMVYRALFGMREVGWMFVNGLIGMFGILTEIDWLLSEFGKSVHDYSGDAHIFPVIYWILATFLIWQLAVDLTGSRDNARRQKWLKVIYSFASIGLYAGLWWSRQP